MYEIRVAFAWSGEDRDLPVTIDVCDEYTIENLGEELPLEYESHLGKGNVREMIIKVPEAVVRGLFKPPALEAQVLHY